MRKKKQEVQQNIILGVAALAFVAVMAVLSYIDQAVSRRHE